MRGRITDDVDMETTQNPTTLSLVATFSTDTGAPQMVQASARISTREIAEAIAAEFPKAIKVRGTGLSGCKEGFTGYVSFNASLVANGVNAGVNETGLRRLRSFIKKAEALGHTVEYTKPYVNSYESMEAFEAAVAEIS